MVLGSNIEQIRHFEEPILLVAEMVREIENIVAIEVVKGVKILLKEIQQSASRDSKPIHIVELIHGCA